MMEVKIMEFLIPIVSIIAFVGGIIIGWGIKYITQENIHDDTCCLYDYDVFLIILLHQILLTK